MGFLIQRKKWLFGAVVIAAFWAVTLGPIWSRIRAGDNDFPVFYCGGKLAYSSDLYQPEACYAIQRQLFGESVPALVYIRMPFHAAALSALAWLPYGAAYAIFQLLQLMAVAWAVWAVARDRRDFLFFACFSPALLLGAANGQDTGFLFAMAVGVWRLLRRRADVTAGMLLSCCAIKPHLFLLVPIVLMVHRRWRAVGGAVAGCVTMLGLSFLTNGMDWPRRFVEAISNPAIEPSLGSLASFKNWTVRYFDGSMAIEAALALALAGSLIWIAARCEQIDLPFAMALVGGVLVGRHAFLHDTVLVLAAFAIRCSIAGKSPAMPMLAMAVLPPGALLLLAGWPLSAGYPLLLAASMGLTVRQLMVDSRSANRGGNREPAPSGAAAVS